MKRARVVPTVRLVHVCPPIHVKTDPSNFRAVVHELTGNGLAASRCCTRDRSKLPEASSPASSYSAALHHFTPAGGGPSLDNNSRCNQHGFLLTASTTIAGVGKHEECGEVIQEKEEYEEGGEAYLYASLNPCLKPQSPTPFGLQDQAPNCIHLHASPLRHEKHVACIQTDDAYHTSVIEGKLEEQEEEREEGESSFSTYNTWSASEDSHNNSALHNGSSEVDSLLLQRRRTAKLTRQEEDIHDQGFMIAGACPRERTTLGGLNQRINYHKFDITVLSGAVKSSPSFSSDSSIVSAWDQYRTAESPTMIRALEDGYDHADEYAVDGVRASSNLGACNMVIDMQNLFDQCETPVTGELLHPSAATVPCCGDFQYNIMDLINLSDLNYHSFDSSFLLA